MRMLGDECCERCVGCSRRGDALALRLVLSKRLGEALCVMILLW